MNIAMIWHGLYHKPVLNNRLDQHRLTLNTFLTHLALIKKFSFDKVLPKGVNKDTIYGNVGGPWD